MSLPVSLAALPELEMLRVAINRIEDVPLAFAACPKLAWASMAGNPVTPDARPSARYLPTIEFSDMEIGEKLGEGASGDVYLVTWHGRQVRTSKLLSSGNVSVEKRFVIFLSSDSGPMYVSRGYVRRREALQYPARVFGVGCLRRGNVNVTRSNKHSIC